MDVATYLKIDYNMLNFVKRLIFPGFFGLEGYPQSGALTPHARGQRANQKSIKNQSKIN